MMGRYYYARIDEEGVDCVDQLSEDTDTEEAIAYLADMYPDVIYFHYWRGDGDGARSSTEHTKVEAKEVLTYYAELIQIDPEDSLTPGFSHYAGEVAGFTTPKEARDAALPLLGKPVPEDLFSPCCDWQKRETPVAHFVVYDEDEWGNRNEATTYYQG